MAVDSYRLVLSFNVGLGFLSDSAWYRSLGYQSVYYTRIGASFGLFVAGFLIAWLFITLNILLARRLEPFGLVGTPPEQVAAAFGVRIPTVLIAAAGVFAFFMGLGIAGDWQQVLLYFNQVPFGVTDPIFGKDVSFFVFTLDVWELLRGWLFLLLLATTRRRRNHGRRRLARLERAARDSPAPGGAGRTPALARRLAVSPGGL